MKSKSRIVILLIAFALMAIVVLAIRQRNVKKSNSASFTSKHFDTIMTITLYSDEKSKDELEEVIDKCFKRIEELELVFSAEDERSELYILNRDKKVEASRELLDCVKRGLMYSEKTDGAFNIGIRPLILLWGIGKGKSVPPSDTEIKEVLKTCNYQDIIISPDEKQIELRGEVLVDLGGIAKGYAADEVKKIIKENDDIYGIIDLGGNIMTIGSKPKDMPWVIGIRNPKSPSDVFATVSVKDKSVVTSGDYERYFEYENVRYHHILSSKTGYPAKGVSSVTIIANDSTTCDAFSTACFVLGVSDGLKLIENTEGVEGVIIDSWGKVYTSGGMDEYQFKEQ